VRIALVIGSGSCVWEDVDAAMQLGEYAGSVACKNMGIVWPGRLDAWASLHPERFPGGQVARRVRGLPPHGAMIGLGDTAFGFPGQTAPGSSGLFALKVALVDLGFDRAVLCGIPMSAEYEHFDKAGAWEGASHHHDGWRQALSHIRDRARSMSGWTADLLGRPDEAWVEGAVS
jgi:hypothetical protein